MSDTVVKAKNPCGKLRPADKPYEVWKQGDWTWKVLKKYQTPEKEKANPYARWHCLVITPYTGESGEYGDCYVHADIIGRGARLVEVDGKPVGGA